MDRLAGKVALISGGARGLGAAFARQFVAEGAKVVIGDVIDPIDGSMLDNPSIRFRKLDVRREESWQQAVEYVEQAFGPVSILVNNAGVIAPGNDEGPIENIEEADFRRVVDVNQVGVLLGMKNVVASMRRSGGGSIVNMSSIGGAIGVPHLLAYVATKWAVIGMTKTAAAEFGQYQIRVNAVLPGAIWTPIHVVGQTEEQAKRTRKAIEAAVSRQPIKRIAEPMEVAKVVLFLASDEASYCSGAEFVVDGGSLARQYDAPANG